MKKITRDFEEKNIQIFKLITVNIWSVTLGTILMEQF